MTLNSSGQSKIILITGVQGSGKSTICSQLQEALSDTYIYLPIDKYIELMPKKLVNLDAKKPSTDMHGITFKSIIDDTGERLELAIGAKAMAWISTYPALVSTIAKQGHNIIIDGVFAGEWLNWILTALKDHKVYVIKLDCSLQTAEAREKSRNSFVGLAKTNYPLLAQLSQYDLLINTELLSPEQSAIEIKKYIERT